MIITYFPRFRKYAYAECALAGASGFRELDKGISVCHTPPFEDFAGFLACVPPVFTRHVMPVMASGVLSGERDADLGAVLEAAKGVVSFYDGEPFTVCCRIVGLAFEDGGAGYNAKDVEVRVGSYFDGLGAKPVFSDYALADGVYSVINVFIFKRKFYLGVCSSAQTIAASPNEYRVLSREARVISRAENKLIEAVSRYKLHMPGGRALDMGASPGGWTNVLAGMGYSVTAVDPGALNPKVLENPNVTHIKDRIERVSFSEPFDILVDDMNITARETARIMNDLAPLLKSGAAAVVTLKLAFADAERQIREAAEILNDAYDIISVASLPHNRAEVTAILRRL